MRAFPSVQNALIFGRGKLAIGAILQLNPCVDRASAEALVLQALDDALRRINEISSSHSHLLRSMVIFAAPEKELPVTLKGQVSRGAAYKLYAEEIEASYSQVISHDINPDISLPQLILTLAGRFHEPTAETSKSFSLADFNSLEVFALSRELAGHFRRKWPSKQWSALITPPRLYHYPSFSDLADFLQTAWDTGNFELEQDEVKAGVARIARSLSRTIKRLSSDSVRPGGCLSSCLSSSSPTIVLVGSTGFLGSHLLATVLARQPDAHVLCLNRRRSPEQMWDHQIRSYAASGAPPTLLHNNRGRISLESVDLEASALGLSGSVLNRVSQASLVFYNAWRVDFNLS